MNKLAVVVAFVLSSLGSAHAAGQKISSARPKGIVAPMPGMLKNYLAGAKGTALKSSGAHNSRYYRITQAVKAKPSNFRKISLPKDGMHGGRVAYIPKSPIKGLPGNTAFIQSTAIGAPTFYKMVHLPMF